MTDYVLTNQKHIVPKGYFLSFWVEVLKYTFEFIFRDFALPVDTVQTLTFIMLPLLLIINLSILPAWRVWQATTPLRWIASLLMIAGLLTTIILITSGEMLVILYLDHFRVIAIDFLTTAIALLLFKNESIDAPHAI